MAVASGHEGQIALGSANATDPLKPLLCGAFQHLRRVDLRIVLGLVPEHPAGPVEVPPTAGVVGDAVDDLELDSWRLDRTSDQTTHVAGADPNGEMALFERLVPEEPNP